MATRSSLTMGAIMLIGNRYETRALLGEGGMGSVYRAYDRLTRQEVALKRVTTPPDTLLFNSRTDSEDLRVALAQEFRIMAGLRHPNIVSVLDYGFETDGAPYFTMTLLEGAQPFLKAAADRTLEQQVQMLIELLQALAYLHRRGVFHRDLKPSNILVDKTAAVRVLDFGLSQTQEEAANADDRIVGTPAYLAPELLEEGGGFSTASDLHAVGVIAYQMLTGKHPYEADTLPLTLSRILTHIPDLSGLPEAVQPVITRLLAKDPAHRYQSATAVIAALEGALGIDTRERAEIRESFLQASRFVGRDDELKTLRQALDQARGGQGAAWLIGGESGVGKSRLLDEIRIRAMTSGITVLQGQGVSGSGQPFQLWRDPMRRLALRSDLSLFEAGVLKEIVPDIDDLLGQTVPKAPQVDARFAVPRLVQTILEVLRRQQAPVMLILEDLQWAEESLEPLRVLNRFAHAYPWLLLGSYRSDERPTLPDDLPGMQTIMLSRLDQQAIAELSVSMIGQRGLEPKVLQFIERETEGNAFFMVEVVRALAEEAGRLSEIGSATLPARVVAGGIQRIIERRLGRVPAEYH
ncbi:MAG: protein kinase, partial [Chloroflexi bacterium]|nr:protein kinase [Chloroflexota bacterium]